MLSPGPKWRFFLEHDTYVINVKHSSKVVIQPVCGDDAQNKQSV